jgi:hypothetical protein
MAANIAGHCVCSRFGEYTSYGIGGDYVLMD